MKWLHTIRNLFKSRAVVLMYHRVADVTLDPWNLAVSPKNFEEQIQWLTSKYKVIPVTELIQNLKQKKRNNNTVCITFDDGYQDNYLFAKPILEKYHCPATFFIPSHFIGQPNPFWWEELQTLLLEAPALPQLFQMPIVDDLPEFDLGLDATLNEEHIKKHHAWRWPEAAPTQRCALFLNVWESLKPLPYSEIETVMDQIRAWANQEMAFSETVLPMTTDQLKELVGNGLFQVGLHTTTHPALAYHTEDVQYWELAENKKRLQLFDPINAVAFPYGNYNNSTMAVLHKQRIEAGFTTEPKRIAVDSKLHCLGRFQVLDKNAVGFEKDLCHWINA